MGQDKFSKNLSKLLKEKKISIRKFSKDINLNPKTVGAWLGPRMVFPQDPEVIAKIADYFGISVHEVMFGVPDHRSFMGQILEKTEIHTGTYEITVKRVNMKGN